MTTPDIHGSAEVCRRVGIDRSTLSRWIKEGIARPALRVSDTPTGAYLFTNDEIDRLAKVADERLRRSA